MSYGVMAFAVDWDELTGVVGSGDEGLVDIMAEQFDSQFEEVDQFDEDDGCDVTSRDALRQLVMGETCTPGVGFKYGYAVKHLCWYLGDFLNNSCWCPISSEWVGNKLDPALERAGVPSAVFSFKNHILYRGSPVPIPEPDDSPCIGYLTPAEVAAAADTLAGIDPETFRPIDGHEQFEQARGWLTECRANGRGLVAFYH